MNIKDIIQKKRERENGNVDWRAIIESVAKNMVEEKFAVLERELKNDADKMINSTIEELTQNLTPEKLKGAPGDTVVGPPGPKPVAGVDYKIPEDGKPGHTPTSAELLPLIKRAMPKVKNGVPGKDGETPTDGRLIKLIKPLLPTKEKLLQLIRPLIKSFERTFDQKINILTRNVQRALRERGGGGASGGGMGNVQHESAAVSSATTTVTTNYKIAGSGFAVWAYYNGQLIARGTHYTVGSNWRTLTLLFTPQDSTNIDIIYIRT